MKQLLSRILETALWPELVAGTLCVLAIFGALLSVSSFVR